MGRWRFLTGVCAMRHKQTKTKKKSENATSEEIRVLSLFVHFHFKLYLTLSLLSARAACLHNGCHTSHPEEEREKVRVALGVSTCHESVYMLYIMCASVRLHVSVWMYWHQISPVRYISSPSLNIMLQRAQRAQVGW